MNASSVSTASSSALRALTHLRLETGDGVVDEAIASVWPPSHRRRLTSLLPSPCYSVSAFNPCNSTRFLVSFGCSSQLRKRDELFFCRQSIANQPVSANISQA